VFLDDVFLEPLRRERQAAGGGHVAAVDGVLAGRDQGEHLVVVVEVGEFEPGRPAHRVQRPVQRYPQLLGQGGQLAAGRPPRWVAELGCFGDQLSFARPQAKVPPARLRAISIKGIPGVFAGRIVL
jgi:hypothetical protein